MSIDLPGVPDRFTNSLYTQGVDISNRLLRERIIVLGKEVDDEVANQTITLLLHLEAEDPEKDIRLQINSPGGSIAGVLAIVDTIQQLNSEVVTICVGQAQGMSTLLVAIGTPNALPYLMLELSCNNQ
jgi:ATP-dependent Clp protease, protease subunit